MLVVVSGRRLFGSPTRMAAIMSVLVMLSLLLAPPSYENGAPVWDRRTGWFVALARGLAAWFASTGLARELRTSKP